MNNEQLVIGGTCILAAGFGIGYLISKIGQSQDEENPPAGLKYRPGDIINASGHIYLIMDVDTLQLMYLIYSYPGYMNLGWQDASLFDSSSSLYDHIEV